MLAGVGGHPPDEALPSLRKITSDISVVFVEAWAAADGARDAFAVANSSGEFLPVADLASAVEAATSLHGRHHIDGVVTFSELLLLPQAQIVQRLGLRGNSTLAVEVAQSKTRQREVFAASGVPSPRSASFASLDAVRSALDTAGGFPVVLKPSLGAGSVGVERVNTWNGLLAAAERALATDSVFLQASREWLLEECMPVEGAPGAVYANYVSVESLLTDEGVHHLAVTDRLRLTKGYAEDGLVLPSHLDEATQDQVRLVASQALAAIGLTHGAVHTEIALTPTGPRVIEVNARAGGPIPSMFEACADYDYAEQIGRSSLGLPVDGAPVIRRAAVHRFVPIPEGEWRLVAQADAAQVRARFREVVYLKPRFAVGQAVSRRLTLHLASFLVAADTLAEAHALRDAVESALGLELEPC